MKNLKFILLLSALVFSLPTWSVDSTQLKKIQDNLCADDSLNKIQTEAAAPCIDCVAKETNSSSPTAELKSVAKKVISELEQNEIDKLELEFYKYVEDRGLLNSGYSNDDSLASLEMQLANYEQTIKSHNTIADQYKLLNAPGAIQDLEKSKTEDAIGPETQAILKKAFSEYVSMYESSLQSSNKYYDENIKLYEEKIIKEPQSELLYKEALEKWKNAKKEANSVYEPYKKIYDWLKKSGKKNELTGQQLQIVEQQIDQNKMVAEQAHNYLKNYKETIQLYENQITHLKAKIEQKKNIKFGEIHSPGAKKNDQNKLEDYRKKAEMINVHHKSNPGYKSCGMSEAEILALRWYTSSHYGWINKALRSGGDEAQKIEPYKKVLNKGLEKLRAYEGEVRRGTTLPEAVAAQHEVGKIVDYQAYTSTSLGAGWSGSHKFVIKSKKGRYVGSHSAHYGENEVLFAAGTKFKVTARQGGEITMEEVDP